MRISPQSAQCLGMAAQRRRPAQLDGAHHAPLDAAEVTVMGAAIGIAVAAEDIRHFQSRPTSCRRIRRAAPPPASAGRAGSRFAGSSPFETRV